MHFKYADDLMFFVLVIKMFASIGKILYILYDPDKHYKFLPSTHFYIMFEFNSQFKFLEV